MGLDPAQVISFGGGWVNHAAPDGFREAYAEVVGDSSLFHRSGGYTARYLVKAVADGSLRRYVEDTNAQYAHAAQVTIDAIDEHLGLPRLTPAGGLYAVVDVRTEAHAFVRRALQVTGVLVVPGGGFGESLSRGVRISYGPLVTIPDTIREGLARLGRWMRSIV